MENYLQTFLAQGQNRAPNTIRLRKMYTDYSTDAQSKGDQPLPFHEWAKTYYHDMKILGN